MIALLLASAVALAAAPKDLDLKLTGPDSTVLFDEDVTLPYAGREDSPSYGGQPFLIDVDVTEKHDTVIVEAAIVHLKGKKMKPVELAKPKLILYEDFQGKVEFVTDVPKGYEGAEGGELTWVLEASWAFQKPPEPDPVATPEPVVEEPAEPAVEEPAVEAPAE
ncbi:MAG: hypothetical protein H6741_13355 [Alphaproteobacteria bacterium]|nr:hypothetical protein [Alphaproteobacteria bacterium]MCB9793703.1 hypothetical protein [Alphaproteobacteria bacterium]